MRGFRRSDAAIFLTSVAVLSFEVLMLRVFSVALWYHFASMVVSIAMLGIAAAGTFLALRQASTRKTPPLRSSYFLILGATLPLSYLAAIRIPFDPVKLSWDGLQLGWISCYYLFLSPPFFVAGIILASAFASQPSRPGKIYAADLCGAAAGTLFVVLVQFRLAAGQAVFLSAALSLLAAVIMGGRRQRWCALLLLAFFLPAAFAAPLLTAPVISPYKELPALLRMSGARTLETRHSPFGRTDLFRSPGVRYAPGLSLKYRRPLPDQIGLAVDGGAVTTVTIPKSAAELSFLEHLPTALAYRLRTGGEVYLLDPRGGLSFLLAGHIGARIRECSESNPAVTEMLASSVYASSLPCRGGMGRNHLQRGGRRYDVIDFPLTGALPSPRPGGGEDYQLTVEAVKIYLDALKDDGILNLSLYITPPYRAELRILTTVLEALEGSAAEPRRHLLAIRSLGLLNLLVRRSPFTAPEIDEARKFTQELWFDPLWHDGMLPGDSNRNIRAGENDLAAAYRELLDPQTRGRYTERYLFDITPSRDNRPYFNDSLRSSRIREVYEMVDGKWDFFVVEGYLLPAVLLQLMLLGGLLVGGPLLTAGFRSPPPSKAPLIYFAFIGLGYLLLEMALIQSLLRPLENPVTAVTVVLGSLLFSSGAGSYLSARFGTEKLWIAALFAAFAVVACLLGIGRLSDFLVNLPLPLRGAVLFTALFPAGFVMGMPFPGGVRFLAKAAPEMIPWAWAVNGFFSVLSPVIASIVAREAGISAVFALALLAYSGAALSGFSFCASPTIGTNRTPPI